MSTAITASTPASSRPTSWAGFAPWALVSPVLVLITLIILLPELWALYLCFTNYSFGKPVRWIGLTNFEIILTDPNFWNAVRVNLVFVVGAVSLQMLAGLGIALLLARRFRLQNLWIALLLAPMAASEAVSAVMWKYLLHYQIGPLNYVLQSVGLERQQFLSSFELALPSVIVVEAWTAIPYVILFLYPARLTFPQELYEAARIDGASAWQTFRYITFPLLRPVFLLCLVFRLMFTIRSFGIVWILTQGGPLRETELLAIYMFNEGFANWRFGSASAVAWLMLLITVLLASRQIFRMYQNMFADPSRQG